MKQPYHLYLFLLLLGLVGRSAQAQGVGIGTTAPDASAALDIVSSSKGALLPRVSSTSAVSAPATGLIVFQTAAPAGYYYYDGASWQQLATAGGATTTATNGLSKTGSTIGLGGTLARTTTVAQAGNSLSFTDGRVGIGTAAPARTLDVTGDFQVQSNAAQINQPSSTGSFGTISNAGQSFTLPAGGGTLLSVQAQSITSYSTTLRLYAGDGTGGTALTSGQPVTFVANTPTTFVLATPLPLAAGVYTFAFATGTGLLGSASNPYAGGQLSGSGISTVSNYDLTFTVSYLTTAATTALYVGTAVGVNTTTPTAQLDVNGSTRLRGLTAAGVVITDADGNLSSIAPDDFGDNLGNGVATTPVNLQANALVGTGSSISGAGVGIRADGGLNVGQNTSGNNIFLGFEAGSANANGQFNLFSGYQTGKNNASGSFNVFTGSGSGTFNASGSYNVFSGALAGFNNATGNYNTALGYNSGPASGKGGLDNTTAVGANVIPTTSNTVILGNGANVGIGTTTPTQKLDVSGNANIASPDPVQLTLVSTNADPNGALSVILPTAATCATCSEFVEFKVGTAASNNLVGRIVYNTATGGTLYSTTSDKRLKEHITPTRFGLAQVLQLAVKDYNFRGQPASARTTGLLAQDLFQVYPDAVREGDYGPTVTSQWAVDYGQLTPLLVQAIQDQQKQIEALKAANATLQVRADRAEAQAAQAAADHADLRTLKEQLATLRAAVLPTAQLVR